MSTVAKRLIFRMPTTAEAYRRPARKVKRVPDRITNAEFAFYFYRAIIVNRNFRQPTLLNGLM